MPELLTPEICVIGGGAGGLSVAAAAAVLGASVVLVEQGRMGGECLNSGCVPSKSLIAAARHAHAVAQARRFGIATRTQEIDFGKVHDHVQRVIAAVAPNDSKERFTALGVRVIDGTARFTDPATVAVAPTLLSPAIPGSSPGRGGSGRGEGEQIEIKARRFVIAAGSRPALPAIAGLEGVPYLTNESVFDLTARPEHLIVIGAGAIGLELAQAFRRLGSAVTVIEAAEPLAREDAECAAVVLDQLAREGVVLRMGAALRVDPQPADARGPRIRLVLRADGGEQAISGSHLLIATGRRPNAEALALDRAGIKYDGGGILVDRRLRTANRRVYAIGDAAGGPQFTHVASYHASVVVRDALFRLPARVKPDILPRVTFTDPELAHVGLTEGEAHARRIRFNVLRWPYHENDRAQADAATTGHIKVIINARGRILGCTIVGAAAGELIATWALAVQRGLNIWALAGMIVPYPTLSEIGKRAALTYFTSGLSGIWVQRLMRLLRR